MESTNYLQGSFSGEKTSLYSTIKVFILEGFKGFSPQTFSCAHKHLTEFTVTSNTNHLCFHLQGLMGVVVQSCSL